MLSSKVPLLLLAAASPTAVCTLGSCSSTPTATSTVDLGDASPDVDAGVASDAGGGADDASPDVDAGVASDAGGGADAGDTAVEGGGGAFACGSATPPFTTGVFPVLNSHCSGELCHGGTALGAFGGPGNVQTTLVNAPLSRDTCDAGAGVVLVSPRNLGASYIMNKLTGVGICPGSSPMPRLGSPLAPADIQTIADWICEGAPSP